MAMIVLWIIFLLALILLIYKFFRALRQITLAAKSIAGGDILRWLPGTSMPGLRELTRALEEISEKMRQEAEKSSFQGTRLDIVLASMVEGIMVTDGKGEVILVNPSLRRLFMIEIEPSGRKPIEIIRNIGVQEIVERLIKDKPQLVTQEITLNFPEEKILKVNAVAVVRNNKLEGAVLVFHDITELRKLEKIRQDFVANVSHELRTPIASIKGYAETLLDGAIEDKANARDFVNIIYQDSDRLANLIDDLLDLSKIESGKMRMVFLPLEPAAAIKRASSIMENQAKVKSITLKLELPAGLPKIKADEARFSQIMLNILDNAIKYTPEGGNIIVSAQPQGGYLEIDITDTGIGIPAEDLPRIFERFYRVDKARSRELGGTGLGLSIVKHIVQAHGGQVWVKSDPASGSTFSFTIPLA